MSGVLIIGATSAIAEAAAREWASEGRRLHLLARNPERLHSIASDLTVRGAESVSYQELDLLDFSRHEHALTEASQALGGLDIVLIAHGTLPDQHLCERDFDTTLRELTINALSVMSLLTHLANMLEDQKHGLIAVITSVAGDRGRQSNYVYGTAKGAVGIFLQGLRQRLCKSGVDVLTIKPGYVDTPMTHSFKKGLLWAQPTDVGRAIAGAVRTKRDIAYVPWFWFWIMRIIRSIPERIFKRMSL